MTLKLVDIVASVIPVVDGKIVLPECVTSVKIDVGLSYDAPHTQNWIDADPGTIVFGFEANPRWTSYITTDPAKRDYTFKDYCPVRPPPYKELEYKNVGSRCFIIPAALGNVSEPTEMDFYITEVSEGCCSLLPPAKDFSAVSKVVKVPVFNLADFFELLPSDRNVDYLKIDVQGMDIQVLKGAGTHLTNRVVFVTAEPETKQYERASENTPQNMSALMNTLGFDMIRHRNTSDPTFLNRKFHSKADVYIFQYF